MDLKQRYLGTLIGVHVGDSLGGPYETWGSEQIAEDLERRGGLTFFDYPNPWKTDGNGETLPAGRPTDDSDQTANLAESLIAKNTLDPSGLRLSLRESVIHRRSLLWDGFATGTGGTTRKALSEDPLLVAESRLNRIGTNGSLMRCSPMALWFGGNPQATDDIWRFNQVRDMSEVTHVHPHSVSACWMYTKVLMNILGGGSGFSYVDDVRTPLEVRVWSRLEDPYDYPYDPGDWPGRGTAEFSLYAALYAFKHASSYAEGIERAVRIGGDTDTYAAIAGALLGAKYGYEAIPKEWRDGILGHDVMYDLALRLYEIRKS